MEREATTVRAPLLNFFWSPMDRSALIGQNLKYLPKGTPGQAVGLLSMGLPSPLGDAVGLLGDAYGYASGKEKLTPTAGLLSLAALAPGVPSRALIADVGGRWFKSAGRVSNGATFKNPVHLKDGRRLSGFNDPDQRYFYGYDKNGVQFTWDRRSLNPDAIDWSRDGNKTAAFLKSRLLSE